MANKNTKYAQCRLEKRDGLSVISTVSYIPAQFAKVGWIVDLKKEDGTWDRGYTVIGAGTPVSDPPDWRKLIKGHRKMTGDDWPKKSIST